MSIRKSSSPASKTAVWENSNHQKRYVMAKKRFLGNGQSRTAMVFKIATLAGHKLTVPELNRIKDINPAPWSASMTPY